MNAPQKLAKPWAELSPREKDVLVSELRSQGHSRYRMAKICGAVGGSIDSVVKRLDNPSHRGNDQVLADRDNRDAKIISMLAEGHSMTVIAERIGSTRGAIAGAKSRMRGRGITLPTTQNKSAAPKAKKVSVRPKAQRPSLRRNSVRQYAVRGGVVGKARLAQLMAAELPVIGKADAFSPLAGTTPVPFGTPHVCKWSVDGLYGRGRLWCGCARVADSSYCASHRYLGTARAA